MSFPSIILALILLLVTGCVLYGIWALLGKSPVLQGNPIIVIGVILLLIFLAITFWLFSGGTKIFIGHRGAYEPDRIHQRALPWKASFRLTPVTLRA